MKGKLFKSIEEIEVWKRGCRLAIEVIDLTSTPTMKKEWGLRDQLRRSAISIPSNIAEGFERESTAEFKRFLLISKGSCGELRTQIYIGLGASLIERKPATEALKECTQISSMISGLIKHLRTSSK